jgi:predicted lipoprotein
MPSFSLPRLVGVGTVGLLAVALAACGDSAVGPGRRLDRGVVSDEVNAIFLPTFDSLAVRSARLEVQLQALAAAPSAGALAAAQTTWRAVRQSYEFGEAFSFGPIETDNIDPDVDTWPVDVNGIQSLIANPSVLTTAYITSLPTTLKGFHAVEYVLFGDPSAPTTAASLTPGQLTYLVAAGQDLANNLANLQAAWLPSAGDYAGAVLTAGEPSSAYSSEQAVMQQIVTQMATQPAQFIYKLQQPVYTDSSIYEESRFSDNTLADIANNLAGTEAMYVGSISLTGNSGLGSIIRANDPTLDATVRAQFAAAAAAIAAITPTFDHALHADPSAILTAANASLSLQKTMLQLVAPALGVGHAGPLGGQPDND